MSAKKKNLEKLNQAKGDLREAARALDDLRAMMLIVDEALKAANDKDPESVNRSALNLSSLCIRTCRELSVGMRSDSRNAEPVADGMLRKAAVGVAALSSYVVVGAATGGADAIVTHQLQQDVEIAADLVVGHCQVVPESWTSDPGDLAALDAIAALNEAGLRGVNANEIGSIESLGKALTDLSALSGALDRMSAVDSKDALLNRVGSELSDMAESWDRGDAAGVRAASFMLQRQLVNPSANESDERISQSNGVRQTQESTHDEFGVPRANDADDEPPTPDLVFEPEGDYSNRVLVGMDFRGMDLTQADFRGSVLDGSDFSGSDLSAARFANTSLLQVRFDDALLVDAKMHRANLTEASLRNADLSMAILTDAEVGLADFTGAVMDTTDLTGTVFDESVSGFSSI